MREFTEQRAMVLGLIDAGEASYANEIAHVVSDLFGRNIIGGLYALLRRMERIGLLVSEKEREARTAPRRYSLTPQGAEELEQWRDHYVKVGQVLHLSVQRPT